VRRFTEEFNRAMHPGMVAVGLLDIIAIMTQMKVISYMNGQSVF
jgi:hypothetical protein